MDKDDSKDQREQAPQESIKDQEVREEERSGSGQQEIEDTPRNRCWRSWTVLEWTQVVFGGLLTLFTIIYAVTSIYQFKYLIEKDRLDQRAWLGIAEQIKRPVLKEGSPLRFSAMIANSGKTPAFKVKARMGAKTFQKGEKFTPIYDVPLENTPGVFGGVLFPGIHIGVGTGPIIPDKEQVGAITNGSIIMYAFGEILYDDVFRCPHHTTFCLVFTPGLVQASACDTYNDATDGPCD